LTAAISDAGVGLQPETGKRRRMRAKRKKSLYLISAIYPFKASANPAVHYLFPADNTMRISFGIARLA
jgi:hypothetical protein